MAIVLNLRDASGRADCKDCPIRANAVCSQCGPTELDQLSTMKTYRTYKAGQTILWAGSEMSIVGSVVVGVASLTRSMEDGRRQVVGLLLPSDFLGRPDREIAPFDVTAATDLTLCCFQRRPFQTLLNRTPALAHRLLEMTFDELDATREWLVLLGRKTASERLASFLVYLGHRAHAVHAGPLSAHPQFDLPLTREVIADCLGLTIETVSRQITALRNSGVIRLEGQRRVHVTDPAGLLAASGADPAEVRAS